MPAGDNDLEGVKLKWVLADPGSTCNAIEWFNSSYHYAPPPRLGDFFTWCCIPHPRAYKKGQFPTLGLTLSSTKKKMLRFTRK